ncbi:DUF4405 domain-containing protein [Celeribacter litoreus]|uniref:DUF4405 domain-containing protein n=1 Tax=Celeribacter litoreus TaxID=2876714 RepID=UPI001CCFCC7A|nr:DUF4405 domain-containing protein [Celeribacter litoreus]MCA0042812.1 DUF4405 domain-containing protein [Celeribacter litoreus]
MLRKWATPLTIASFTIVGITGVLWYFHQVTGIARWMHEIIGLAMVLIVAFHVVLNWRPFKLYFKRPVGLAVIALGVVLTVGAYAWPEAEGRAGGPPNFAAFGAFADETLGTLAPIFDTDTGTLIARLDAAGYAGASAETTVEDLAGSNTRAQMTVFSAMVVDAANAGQGAGGMGIGAGAQGN